MKIEQMKKLVDDEKIKELLKFFYCVNFRDNECQLYGNNDPGEETIKILKLEDSGYLKGHITSKEWEIELTFTPKWSDD